MKRRNFIKSLGAAVAGVSVASRSADAWAPRTRLTRIGLELYAVRDAMKLDPERTLATVREIGYTDVELLWSFNNFDRTPQQVRDTLAKTGLRAPSAHIAPEILTKDWDTSLSNAKLLGHDYLIVPSLPAQSSRTIDDWKKWADIFNTAGAQARKAGIWLAFHTEPEHVRPIGGVVPYDVFIDRTDAKLVRHQLDVGNTVMGGGDPMRYLQKYPERFWSFHVKDIAADHKSDTELGAGSVNLRALLGAVRDINNKPCYIEQEAAKDSIASARRNYQYLKALEF